MTKLLQHLTTLGALFFLILSPGYATETSVSSNRQEPLPIAVLVVDGVLDFKHQDLAPYINFKAMNDLKLEDLSGKQISWKTYHDRVITDIQSKLDQKTINSQMQALKLVGNPNRDLEDRISALEKLDKISSKSKKHLGELHNYLHGSHVTGLVLGKESPADLTILFFPFFRNIDSLRSQVKVFKDSQELTSQFERNLKSNLASISLAITQYNVKVVNLSFGISVVSRPAGWWGKLLPKSTRAQFSSVLNHFSDLEVEAFENLFLAHPDTLFVKSAGNKGTDLRIQNQNRNLFKDKKPPNLVVVGSLDEEGKLDFFSSYGPGIVDVAARGEKVESSCIGGGQIHLSGTSMAAPIITGHLARYLKVHPQWKAVEALDHFLHEETQIQPALKDKITEGRVFNCKAAPIPKISELDFIEP